MLPFSPNIANQGNNGAPKGPLSQQVPSNPNNATPNFMPFQGQAQVGFTPNAQNPTPFNNPNFVPGSMAANSLLGPASANPNFMQPNQQTHGAFGLQNLSAASGFPMNAPLANLVAQNLYSQQMFGNSSMGGMNPNASMVNAQLALQNQLQGVNQFLNMVLSNPAQLGALSQLMACGNQVPQGVMPQNNNFLGNAQMGPPQPNGVNLGQQRMFPSSNNQNAPQQYQAPNQQMQMNSCAPKQLPNLQMQMNPCVPNQFPAPNQQMQMNSAPNLQMQMNSCAPKQFPASNPQMQVNSCAASSSGSSLPTSGQAMGYQGTQGNRDKTNFSTPNHRQNNNFNRDRGGASNWGDRPQKPQNQFRQNMNGKPNFSGENSDKGNAKDSGAAINDSKAVKRRSLMMQYSEKEIQQWREERKKYYPTKVNVEKKHVHDGESSGDAEQETKLRREQLKNVLAKQAELGFDVPEIPSHYLSDQVGQNTERDHGRKRPFKQNERFQNKFNKKGRFDNRDRFSKQRGSGDQEPLRKNSRYTSERQKPDQNHASRSPTLLEKLLKTDIKRDRSQLLQAFRFMAMNSFFQDDGKPLKFPEVRVKETSETLPLVELGSELGGLSKIEELDDLEDGSDVETPKDQAEEGELTD